MVTTRVVDGEGSRCSGGGMNTILVDYLGRGAAPTKHDTKTNEEARSKATPKRPPPAHRPRLAQAW